MTALHVLGILGEHAEPALPLLLETAAGGNSVLGVRALEALEQISRAAPELRPRMSPLLQPGLSNAEAVRRITRFKLQGPLPVQSLAKAMKDEDMTIRRAAASLIAKQGDEARLALTELIEALANPEDQGVRFFAAQSLQTLGPAAAMAIPALTEALQDSSDMVRSAAAGALSAIQAESEWRGNEP